jgi:hypothetical protein
MTAKVKIGTWIWINFNASGFNKFKGWNCNAGILDRHYNSQKSNGNIKVSYSQEDS